MAIYMLTVMLSSTLLPVAAFDPQPHYARDPVLGKATEATADELVSRFNTKTALVVGGTDGIGRAIALALAKAGADVFIAGHSPTKAEWVVANMSVAALKPEHQRFDSYAGDLSVVSGCSNFTQTLSSKGLKFDYVVLTVGVWPDPIHPQTAEGVDKMIALDVMARAIISDQLLRGGLNPKARIMSILASTKVWPLPPSEDEIKSLVNGSTTEYGVFDMVQAAAISHDAWLVQASSTVAARNNSGVHFIGACPGIVKDGIIDHIASLPTWLKPFMRFLANVLGTPPDVYAQKAITILSCPNAEKRTTSFFDEYMQGRKTVAMAYDEQFGSWLWAWIEKMMRLELVTRLVI